MYFVTQELKMHNDALFEHMEVIESYKVRVDLRVKRQLACLCTTSSKLVIHLPLF